MTLWQPSASRTALLARQSLYQTIRRYFAEQGVLEVDTPILGQAPVSDPNIDVMSIDLVHTDTRRYLHTSPEYAMKRLLCAGSGDIYQICKVFRAGEAGQRHNPEFTMLEWYRLGWSLSQLMDEVATIVHQSLETRWPRLPVLHFSYAEAMQRFVDIDVHRATDSELAVIGTTLAGQDLGLSRDGWLDIIMSHQVEPALPSDTLVFINDFPASQAALAQVTTNVDGIPVAQRFELFFNGTELANGYFELTDPAEQRQRFQQERERGTLDLERPLDENLLAALASGLPSCVGVAMGLDRLLMHQQQASSIAEVLSFDWTRA
ncbi:EF-P lysine aminoacylase EpmA [Thalassolituus oleivorans]|uniref:EF-P lysine aminoacylase EpmA n=1 Tax=Thalassolituus oleivorans TaxID=187493 RepID=UPI00240A173C|nr:EF-P lysine aminoacylase EpmA [Thalassolituus oleivorans]MDF1642407.1 EF-P lysine aminoacylase EpmA [Thalassolituus oleivorans]